MSTTDSRKYPRFPSSRPVVMFIGDKSIFATMTDFSRDGLGFIAAIPPALNSMIEVHFDIAEGNESHQLHPFQFKAIVRHCINLSHESHIGVELDLPSQEYLGMFEDLEHNDSTQHFRTGS